MNNIDKESEIPVSVDGKIIPVDKPVVNRLSEILREHKLEAKIAGGALFFTAAAALSVEITYRHHQKVQTERHPSPLSQEQEAEFSRLFETHKAGMLHYFEYRGLSDADAEEQTADVFLHAYSHFSKFEPRTDLPDPSRAWLYKIAGNSLKNFYRHTSRHPEIAFSYLAREGKESPEDIEDRLPNPEDTLELQIIDRQESTRSIDALHRLIPRYQLVIWLKKMELQNKEIGYILNTSENAVKSLFHRAILAYSKNLDQAK